MNFCPFKIMHCSVVSTELNLTNNSKNHKHRSERAKQHSHTLKQGFFFFFFTFVYCNMSLVQYDGVCG